MSRELKSRNLFVDRFGGPRQWTKPVTTEGAEIQPDKFFKAQACFHNDDESDFMAKTGTPFQQSASSVSSKPGTAQSGQMAS
jgi:hypothetical protein